MNKAMKALVALLIAVSLFLSPAISSAQVPQTINYQGYLTDDLGAPVNGFFDVFFELYDSETLGASQWSETQNVEVIQGVYNVTLGQINPIAVSMSSTLWFEVAIDEDGSTTIEPGEIMSPRQKLSAVPFAINADRLDGLDSADFAASVHEHGGDEITTGTIDQFIIDSAIARDNEIMPTVLANDGPASGLNADLLDGKHASEFGDIQAVRAGNGINVANPESGNAVVSVKAPLSLFGGGTEPVIKGEAASGNSGVQGMNSSGNTGELGGFNHAVRGDHIGGNFGTIGTVQYGVQGESAAGTGVYGRSTTGVAAKFSSSGTAAILAIGNVGINVMTPSQALEVSGTIKADNFMGNGYQITNIRTSNLNGSIEDSQVASVIARDSEIIPAVQAVYDTNADNKVDAAADADTVGGQAPSSFAASAHDHSGINITSGTIADARIASSIARDSEVVNLVKAGDGAGSGIDADLLDGQHASDIIDAASDEVRSPISSCTSISQSGSYYFTGNITAPSNIHCIMVTADNVTIDMMGFHLIGSGSSVYNGFYLNSADNIKIRNGSVSNFSVGILGLLSGKLSVTELRVFGNVNTGIQDASDSAKVVDSFVFDNGSMGIDLGQAAVVSGNTVYGNGHTGIQVLSNALVEGNIVRDNRWHGIYSENGAVIRNNSSYTNAQVGIWSGFGSVIIHNSVYMNTLEGIDVSNSCLIANNAITYNNGYGIGPTSGSTIENNSIGNNVKSGMHVSYDNIIRNNTIADNNTGKSTSGAGIYAFGDNRIEGNHITGSMNDNIYLYSDDNIIIGNTVNDSSRFGIYFRVTGNYFKDNLGSGNTTLTFGGSVPTNTADGGGNTTF
ncbi:right-handed parallel beta-helix repeat-containing protein [bacterium]|nr:right-handed parallel beta-helix repeat-containing protein [bacterium]